MIKNEELDRLESHWAVSAIPEEIRRMCFETIRRKNVCIALEGSIDFECSEESSLEKHIKKVAMAYEMPAIENITSFTNYADETCDRTLFVAAAWRCFDLYTNIEISKNFNDKVFSVLRVCAMAYCGERWNDLKKWYLDNKEEILTSSQNDGGEAWNVMVLKTIYRCWLKLFIKKDWNDLAEITKEIVNIRDLQKLYESEYLEAVHDAQYGAMVLVSLYHLAKCTELLSMYMIQGEPSAIRAQLEKHFESAIECALCAKDVELETLLRWLQCAASQMVENSIWWVAKAINSRTTDFVKYVTKNRGVFEMLPPQRAAIREQGLLDQAAMSIAIEMPTSGGKTMLAEFKMLQALNQFDSEKGWVAYVAPTKALTAQITRRLRNDFGGKIRVEQLSAAVEVDAYESELLSSETRLFDILVATPEKMNMVIKNKGVKRPLALVVMDEAHNMEDEERGLRIELLLATIKTDCPNANFLLLMPYVENAETLSRWLADDVSAGKSISIGSTPWKPSERVVGGFEKKRLEGRGDWCLEFETMMTMSDTVDFDGKYLVNGHRHFNKTYSQVGKIDMTAAMAKELSGRGTCLAIARTTQGSWTIAKLLLDSMEIMREEECGDIEKIRLVQRYLADEMGNDFILISMLDKGIGVHNAGLPEEVKSLMEWLAEENCLKVLCATTTIAQGINFPVSSVLIQSISMPTVGYSKEMSSREFWNLAGRAGRIGQNSLGLVGLACDGDKAHLMHFVSEKTGALVSRLVRLMDSIEEKGQLFNLDKVIYRDEWTDFRCYIAHLCNEKEKLDDVIADMEQMLRNTYGYNVIKAGPNGVEKSKQLLEASKQYAAKLMEHPQISKLADQTGFSPEGVMSAFASIRKLDNKLTAEAFASDKIFGGNNILADMYGIMLKIPQLRQLEEIAGDGNKHRNIANITTDWVSGKSFYEIAQKYFSDATMTERLTKACKAINKQIANCGTWGISAITKLSGIDFDKLTEEQRKEIDTLPAMIYHGVSTSEAVLMRMNSVPRSISESMGAEYKKGAKEHSVEEAKSFIKSLGIEDWDRLKRENASMSGGDYMRIWKLFSGQ